MHGILNAPSSSPVHKVHSMPHSHLKFSLYTAVCYMPRVSHLLPLLLAILPHRSQLRALHKLRALTLTYRHKMYHASSRRCSTLCSTLWRIPLHAAFNTAQQAQRCQNTYKHQPCCDKRELAHGIRRATSKREYDLRQPSINATAHCQHVSGDGVHRVSSQSVHIQC